MTVLHLVSVLLQLCNPLYCGLHASLPSSCLRSLLRADLAPKPHVLECTAKLHQNQSHCQSMQAPFIRLLLEKAMSLLQQDCTVDPQDAQFLSAAQADAVVGPVQVLERIKDPLMTLLSRDHFETAYAVLCHFHLIAQRAPIIFSQVRPHSNYHIHHVNEHQSSNR